VRRSVARQPLRTNPDLQPKIPPKRPEPDPDVPPPDHTTDPDAPPPSGPPLFPDHNSPD
jgi:hypothetical protein